MQLQWDRRIVREPFAGQQRISVPLSGGPPPRGGGRDLTYLLDSLWVGRPAEPEWFAMTSVVALIARDPESLGAIPSYSLLLLITAPAVHAGGRVDSPQMEFDLAAALVAVQTVEL